MSGKTRKSTRCPILGELSYIQENKLPKTDEVLRNVLLTEICNKNNKMRDILSAAINTTADKVQNIWVKASIPTISRQRIIALINKHHVRRRNILKKTKDKNFDKNATNAQNEWNCLFDVAACKCSNFNACFCMAESKVQYGNQ